MPPLSTASRRADAASLAARYDAAAFDWHRKITRLGYPGAYLSLAQAAAARIGPARPGAPLRVLDAGAGTGAFSLAFARTRTEPLALDLLDRSAPMLARAEAHLAEAGLACRLLAGGLGERPLEDGAYDVVLCSHLVEHLPDPATGLAALREALRPGGALLLVVSRPHWCTALLRFVWGHRALADAEVAILLARAGFADPLRHAFPAGPPSRTSRGHVATRPEAAA